MEDLFQAFSDPIRNCEALIKSAAIKSFEPKTMIVSEKDEGDSVYFILTGAVDVTKFSSHGREVWHSQLEAGQQFGEMSALSSAPRSANIVAVEETTTAIVSRVVFLQIIRDDPDLALWFLQDLATRLENSTRQTYEVVTMNVPKRICAELAKQLPDKPDSDGEYPITPKPVLAQLARHLNTDRETISRGISGLVKRNILRRDERVLSVIDLEKLLELADE